MKVDRRHLVCVVLLAAATGCSKSATGPTPYVEPDFADRDGLYTVSHFESAARGRVRFSVYLPPGWSPEGIETYPLIFFLHGQSGDEHSFTRSVPVSEFNEWITGGLVPPFVLVAPHGADIPSTVQWYYPDNVALLTSDAPNELRAFSWRKFRAGGSPTMTSVHGHSRGASGALYFALNYWDRFSSAVANAFVSDYVLNQRRDDATANHDAIIDSGISIRMTIGTEDSYSVDLDRIGSPALHEHMDTLGIPHEYQLLPGVTHSLSSIWHFQRANDDLNGLYELQFHAASWAQGG